MTKTFKQLMELDNEVGSMYLINPELKKGKFGYAYKRFFEKNVKSVISDYKEALLDIRIDHALVNEETKALITNESQRGFEYSKEGLKAVLKAERQLEEKFDIKEIEIEPYIVKNEDLPELNDEQREMFLGIFVEDVN